MGEYQNEGKNKVQQEGILNVFISDIYNKISEYNAIITSIEAKTNNILQFDPEPKDPEKESKKPNSAVDSLIEAMGKMNDIKHRMQRINKHLSRIIS